MPVVVACALVAGAWLGYATAPKAPTPKTTTSSPAAALRGASKIDLTLSLVDRVYVDSVDRNAIVEALMPRLMEQLDPHSTYIPASEMQQVNEPLEGEFDGIGVVFNMATDTVVVLNIIAGGPS